MRILLIVANNVQVDNGGDVVDAGVLCVVIVVDMVAAGGVVMVVNVVSACGHCGGRQWVYGDDGCEC